MELYNIITENYNKIFPLGKNKIDFIKSLLHSDNKFLDVGCATGELCIELSKEGYKVYGIDLNTRMIEIAKLTAKTGNLSIDFKVLDMLNISGEFNKGEFSLITCFGNTLPHLASLSEISDFFKQTYVLLVEDGTLVFQILNYDNIMAVGHCEFPTIKGVDFVFTRKYEMYADKIRFIIEMESRGKKLSDSTFLFPLKKEPAVSELKKAGFRDIQCYADYSFAPSSGKEFATLYLAKK